MSEPTLTLADKFPTVGQPTKLSNIDSRTEALVITYQPDARAAQSVETVEVPWRHERAVGEMTVTPSRAGIMKIEAKSDCTEGVCAQSLAVIEHSVKFDGVPSAGLGIFIVAAFLLFGGAVWSLRLIMKND